MLVTLETRRDKRDYSKNVHIRTYNFRGQAIHLFIFCDLNAKFQPVGS